jgi:hypothetical protein
LLLWAALRGPDGGTLPMKLLQVCLFGDARMKAFDVHSVRSWRDCGTSIAQTTAFLKPMTLCVHAERRVDSSVYGL